MKTLLWYMDEFQYEPSLKTLETASDNNHGASHKEGLVAFIHAEENDNENAASIEKKMAKLLKWAAKKNATQFVVLHSFAHLAESKATPQFTQDFFDKLQERLENAGYKVVQTLFGYFLDVHIHAPGKPSARIFKSIQ